MQLGYMADIVVFYPRFPTQATAWEAGVHWQWYCMYLMQLFSYSSVCDCVIFMHVTNTHQVFASMWSLQLQIWWIWCSLFDYICLLQGRNEALWINSTHTSRNMFCFLFCCRSPGSLCVNLTGLSFFIGPKTEKLFGLFFLQNNEKIWRYFILNSSGWCTS